MLENRKHISHLLDKKVEVEGIFSSYRVYKSGRYLITRMLLTDVKVNDIYIEHLWIECSRRIRNINLKEGTVISFSGKVGKYFKGYNVIEKRNIEVIKEGDGQDLVEFIDKQDKENLPMDLLQFYYMRKREQVR